MLRLTSRIVSSAQERKSTICALSTSHQLWMLCSRYGKRKIYLSSKKSLICRYSLLRIPRTLKVSRIFSVYVFFTETNMSLLKNHFLVGYHNYSGYQRFTLQLLPVPASDTITLFKVSILCESIEFKSTRIFYNFFVRIVLF